MKDTIDHLRDDIKDKDDKAHAMTIGVHKRLDTFAGTMQQIEDMKASNIRIASELTIIKEELKPIAVMRSKIDLHSKVLGFIAAGIGGGLITAFMALILKGQ